MGSFSTSCGHKILGSSTICSNSTLVLSNGCHVKLVIKKIASLRISCSNLSFSSCISCNSFFPEPYLHKTQNSSPRSRIMASKANGEVNRGTPDEKPKERKKFLLRFRRRIRLILGRIRMPHLQPVLREKLSYLRRNSKKAIIFALISIVLGVCLLMARVVPILSPKSMPYSDFVANLHSGIVSDVLFIEGSKGLCYNTSADEPEGLKLAKECGILSRMRKSREWKFQTSMVGRDEAFLLGLMREKGTTYRSAPMSAFRMLGISLATLMALWIPLTPIMWFYFRTMRGGHGSMMKRRPTNQMVCFDDVEGVDSAKEELMEVVSCLQGSINYNKLGAKLPRGILLVGPPGTGKTLLARAVAGEACVPFFFVSASEFVEMYVGRGAARVRDLFKDARKCEPSIIFIDELDAVGGRRGGSSNDERDQTLIQLLTEMDGFETSSKVVVIAATNRPEALDPALCRSGRFSRKVLVGEPDMNGRKKILAVHLRGIPLDEHPELICNLVSTLTPGSVGADLANIVNEAALLAARRGGDAVTREDFMLAIERGKFGIGRLTPTAISKNLGRLFPWVQSLSRRDDPDQDGIRRYRTLI